MITRCKIWSSVLEVNYLIITNSSNRVGRGNRVNEIIHLRMPRNISGCQLWFWFLLSSTSSSSSSSLRGCLHLKVGNFLPLIEQSQSLAVFVKGSNLWSANWKAVMSVIRHVKNVNYDLILLQITENQMPCELICIDTLFKTLPTYLILLYILSPTIIV